jgi:hypothetical protein
MGLDMIHGPKAKKCWRNTKTDSEYLIVSMIPIGSGCIWTWDQFHWKGYLLSFPRSLRTSQLDVICDLGISFNVNSTWMSWTLDFDIFSAILVEYDFSWTWD